MATKEREQLPEHSVFLWFDFMQSVSLPLANVELGDMFYGSDRMEATVFGVHLVQNLGGPGGVKTKRLVILSDVIEHNVLFAIAASEKVKQFIENWDSIKHITMWADCGLHFRAYAFLGWAYKRWFQQAPQAVLRFNYFVKTRTRSLRQQRQPARGHGARRTTAAPQASAAQWQRSCSAGSASSRSMTGRLAAHSAKTKCSGAGSANRRTSPTTRSARRQA